MLNAKHLADIFTTHGYRAFYQPIVKCAGDPDSSVIVGYESLCRRYQNGVTIGAFDAIEEARRAGLLSELDGYMAMLNVGVSRSLPENNMLTCNVSARSLTDYSLISRVEVESVKAQNMVLEITEGDKLNKKEFAILGRAIDRLKDRGWKIAIDDFGDGHSSLRYFNRLDVDIVKISRDTLLDITTARNKERRKFMKDMVSSLKAQLITVIIEGVETESELKVSQQLGADYHQGFLFGEPSERWLPGLLAESATRITRSAYQE